MRINRTLLAVLGKGQDGVGNFATKGMLRCHRNPGAPFPPQPLEAVKVLGRYQYAQKINLIPSITGYVKLPFRDETVIPVDF